MTYENISTVVTPDLAYTVGLERYRAHLAGQAEPELMVLRVTHVFRREDGAWKVTHRHADALAVKQEAAPGVQR
jgi:ketosteroid isomerase-like protein